VGPPNKKKREDCLGKGGEKRASEEKATTSRSNLNTLQNQEKENRKVKKKVQTEWIKEADRSV